MPADVRTIDDLEFKMRLHHLYNEIVGREADYRVRIKAQTAPKLVGRDLGYLRPRKQLESLDMVLTIGYGAGLAFSKAKGQIAKGGRVGFQYEGHIGMVWEKEPENRIVDINDYRH